MTVGRALLLMLVVGALPFLGALHAGFVYDDIGNLVANGSWRGLSPEHLQWMATAKHMGHWMPLTWFSFAVDHAVWGTTASGELRPMAFHATNLVLHSFNSAMVFALLLLLLRRTGRESVLAAVACALLWAWHPLRVESVAWVTERRDVLATSGYLLAVLAYLRATCSDDGRHRWWVVALLATAGSLLAKAWAITMPAVLIAIDLVLRRPLLVKRQLAEKLPFVLLALPAGYMAIAAQSDAGAMQALGDHALGGRLVQACYGLGWYVGRSLWPVDLLPIYPLEDAIDPWAPEHLGAMAFVLVATVGVFVAWRRGHRGPLAAWLAYAAILSPVLGLTQSGQQKVADRYSYLAVIPLVALLAAVLARIERERARKITAGAVVIVLALLAWRTTDQTGVWRNSHSLWNHTLSRAPDNWIALTGRAVAYSRDNEPDKAIVDFERALELEPRFSTAIYQYAVALDKLKRRDEALAHFDTLIARAPEWALPYYGRGYTLMNLRRYSDAVDAFDRCIARRPGLVSAWNNRGNSKRGLRDFEGAAADLRQAVTLDAGHWKARTLLGDTLRRLGKRDEARKELERALEQAPEASKPSVRGFLRRVQ